MAVARSRQVLQFRLFLEGTQPLVWRRFRVASDFTLERLHRVIQTVMDWQDYHLHEFRYAGRAYGVPDPDYDYDRVVVEDRNVRLGDLNLSAGDRLEYVYDFGDNWEHVLQLEEALPSNCQMLWIDQS